MTPFQNPQGRAQGRLQLLAQTNQMRDRAYLWKMEASLPVSKLS